MGHLNLEPEPEPEPESESEGEPEVEPDVEAGLGMLVVANMTVDQVDHHDDWNHDSSPPT